MSELLLGFAFGRHFVCIDGLLMDIYVDTRAMENASACVASALQDPYATRREKLKNVSRYGYIYCYLAHAVKSKPETRNHYPFHASFLGA